MWEQMMGAFYEESLMKEPMKNSCKGFFRDRDPRSIREIALLRSQ